MVLLDLARRLIWPTGPGAFRLWLALVVVWHHFTRIELGKAPVLVFFALSGYWIHRMWQERYARALRPYVTFLISRWWRITPMMALSTLLSIMVMLAFGMTGQLQPILDAPLRHAFTTLFPLGYAMLPGRAVGPGWSLDIEMQFYVLAPLMVIAVRRLAPALALGGALAIQAAALSVWPDVVLTTFLPWFVIGMVAAKADWSPPPLLANLGMAGAMLLVAGAFVSPWRDLVLTFEAPYWPQFNMLAALMVIPFAMRTVSARGDRFDGVLADQSYVSYLMHWPLVLVLLFRKDVTTGHPLLDGLIYIALIAALSWAARRWFDHPLNTRRSRWVAARIRAGEAESGASGAKRDDTAPLIA